LKAAHNSSEVNRRACDDDFISYAYQLLLPNTLVVVHFIINKAQ